MESGQQDINNTSLSPLGEEDTVVDDESTLDSDDTLVAPGEYLTPSKRTIQHEKSHSKDCLVGNIVSVSVQTLVAAFDVYQLLRNYWNDYTIG